MKKKSMKENVPARDGGHTPGMMCRRGPWGEWCFSCKALLSAAPDLLAASKAALHYYLDVVGDTEPAFVKELQAAIRKAEGGKP